MHSRCCCPPDSPAPGLSSRSLTSFQRLAPCSDCSTTSSSCFLSFTPLSCRPAATLSRIDMVGNGFGRWNTMPTVRRTATGSIAGGVEVLVVQHHRALDAAAGDHLVHPVQGPQEGRLAAAGRPDERRDRARLDRHRHVLDGLEVAVVDVEVLDVDALGHGRCFVVSRCRERVRSVRRSRVSS